MTVIVEYFWYCEEFKSFTKICDHENIMTPITDYGSEFGINSDKLITLHPKYLIHRDNNYICLCYLDIDYKLYCEIKDKIKNSDIKMKLCQELYFVANLPDSQMPNIIPACDEKYYQLNNNCRSEYTFANIIEILAQIFYDYDLPIEKIQHCKGPAQYAITLSSNDPDNICNILLIVRYLLLKTTKKLFPQFDINYFPKLFMGNINGSSCHLYYTDNDLQQNNQEHLKYIFDKLEEQHGNFMNVCGTGNLTRFEKNPEFTITKNNKTGLVRYNENSKYIQDTRPGANINPLILINKYLDIVKKID